VAPDLVTLKKHQDIGGINVGMANEYLLLTISIIIIRKRNSYTITWEK
jgi:hypothetical protein